MYCPLQTRNVGVSTLTLVYEWMTEQNELIHKLTEWTHLRTANGSRTEGPRNLKGRGLWIYNEVSKL